MRQKNKSFSTLSDILKDVLNAPVAEEKSVVGFLDHHWPRIVGEKYGRKSKPFKIYGHRLVISVTESVWAQEMDFCKSSFLENAKKIQGCPRIDEIRFFIESTVRTDGKKGN